MLGLVVQEIIWYLKEMVFLGDATALWRYYRRGSADVVFFYRAAIDEQWLQSTVEQSQKRFAYAVVVNRRHATQRQMHNSNNYCVSLFVVRLFRCKVFVSTASTLSSSLVWPGTKYIVHMPHSLASFHMIYPQDAFDVFNVIFCSGEHHVTEIKALDRLSGREDRQCFEVGYGKMDLLKEEYEEFLRTSILEGKGINNKTILLAPSWGKDNILDTIGLELVEALLENGYEVVIRPHPIQAKTAQVLFDLEEKYKGSNRFFVEDVMVTHASLYSADLMISDYSGVAYEFAFLRERPVLFLDVPKKVVNPDWETVGLQPLELHLRKNVGAVVPINNLKEIFTNVEALLEAVQEKSDQIIEMREKYLFNYDNCAQTAVQRIVELIDDASLDRA